MERSDPWFEPLHFGSVRNFSLDQVHHQMVRYEADPVGYAAMHAPGQSWLCGYVIPEFQRPLVWDRDRQVAFVESARRGLNLGTWIYNDTSSVLEGPSTFHKTDRWLIDGQQRFNALREFWHDAFPVGGLLWSEVGGRDRRKFLMQPFTASELSVTDERDLRRIYDLHNFGGVPHLESQRASLPEEEPPGFGPR